MKDSRPSSLPALQPQSAALAVLGGSAPRESSLRLSLVPPPLDLSQKPDSPKTAQTSPDSGNDSPTLSFWKQRRWSRKPQEFGGSSAPGSSGRSSASRTASGTDSDDHASLLLNRGWSQSAKSRHSKESSPSPYDDSKAAGHAHHRGLSLFPPQFRRPTPPAPTLSHRPSSPTLSSGQQPSSTSASLSREHQSSSAPPPLDRPAQPVLPARPTTTKPPQADQTAAWNTDETIAAIQSAPPELLAITTHHVWSHAVLLHEHGDAASALQTLENLRQTHVYHATRCRTSQSDQSTLRTGILPAHLHARLLNAMALLTAQTTSHSVETPSSPIQETSPDCGTSRPSISTIADLYNYSDSETDSESSTLLETILDAFPEPEGAKAPLDSAPVPVPVPMPVAEGKPIPSNLWTSNDLLFQSITCQTSGPCAVFALFLLGCNTFDLGSASKAEGLFDLCLEMLEGTKSAALDLARIGVVNREGSSPSSSSPSSSTSAPRLQSTSSLRFSAPRILRHFPRRKEGWFLKKEDIQHNRSVCRRLKTLETAMEDEESRKPVPGIREVSERRIEKERAKGGLDLVRVPEGIMLGMSEEDWLDELVGAAEKGRGRDWFIGKAGRRNRGGRSGSGSASGSGGGSGSCEARGKTLARLWDLRLSKSG